MYILTRITWLFLLNKSVYNIILLLTNVVKCFFFNRWNHTPFFKKKEKSFCSIGLFVAFYLFIIKYDPFIFMIFLLKKRSSQTRPYTKAPLEAAKRGLIDLFPTKKLTASQTSNSKIEEERDREKKLN